MPQHNNLKTWREQAGLSMEQLAEKLDISAASVSRIENGVQQPRPALLAKICTVFTRSQSEFYQNDAAPIPTTIGTRRIPLFDYVQAGTFTGVDIPHGDAEMQDYLLTDGHYSKAAFAFKIRGESMLPRFREGDTIIVDPAVQPRPNEFVVARNGSGEATFKQYKDRGHIDGRPVFELVPLNDGYPSIRSDTSPIEIVGTMVEHRQYRPR